MATTEPRTPPLPVEITENIIQLYLGGPYTFPNSHFSSDLAPLLLNSRLANLVRFFTFESKCFDDGTVFGITEIISLSLNLTHLSIRRLGKSWKKIDAPVGKGLETDTLCSPEETLALLANWPDLEEFSLVDQGFHLYPLEFPTGTPACCLALRRVKVRGFDIACTLAKMAPNVKDADIAHDTSMEMETLACLHTWSETLIRLKLCFAVELRVVIPYFPPLRKLRYFYCEAPAVQPRCLESMDSLEELFYCGHPEQVKQLVNCFRLGAGSGDFLPALKVLRFRSAFLLLDPELEFSQDEYDKQDLGTIIEANTPVRPFTDTLSLAVTTSLW
ncbi:hypothetical protein DFH11DRAFT_1734353 [Phellopilus nigrolimitatus]|nr:hypothetical protein DFH11DRAFT_1734353 [Phellopilus nigrolimitatus]